MSPEVQIRIIDLAMEWVVKTPKLPESNAKVMIDDLAERFDQAYRLALKSISAKDVTS
jgi:hypothetical protein